MNIRTLILATAVVFGAVSCSPGDKDQDPRAKKFAAAHTHPFEFTETDSSLVARYTLPDTLKDYGFSIWIPDDDGVLRMVQPSASTAYPTLIPDMTYEWSFDALGLDSLTDGCTIIYFDRKTLDDAYTLIWEYEHGSFQPLLQSYD